MKHAAVTLIVLTIALVSTRAQKTANEITLLVYNNITEGASKLDRDIKKAYPGKFRFIDVKQSDGFTEGHMKGFSPSWVDPRPMREEAIPGKVIIAYVVTPEGSVIEPRAVQSTDKRVAKFMMDAIVLRHFVPSRFRGKPVFSLWSDEFSFGPDASRAEQNFNDGLGIQGGRDR